VRVAADIGAGAVALDLPGRAMARIRRDLDARVRFHGAVALARQFGAAVLRHRIAGFALLDARAAMMTMPLAVTLGGLLPGVALVRAPRLARGRLHPEPGEPGQGSQRRAPTRSRRPEAAERIEPFVVHRDSSCRRTRRDPRRADVLPPWIDADLVASLALPREVRVWR